MSIEFLVTALIVCVLPGTGVIYTLAVGLGRGFSPSVVAAFGCTLGILPHAFASIVGLAAILHASATAFQIVKVLGVLFLFYMALGILQNDSALTVSAKREPISPVRLIRDGILLNVLNPKLSLFFLAFLPQFVPVGTANPTHALIGLALVFMAMTFAVFVLYGACAAAARDYVVSRPIVLVWLKRSFAIAFVVLGLRIALSNR